MFAAIQNWVMGRSPVRPLEGLHPLPLEGLEKEWSQELLLGVPHRRQALAEIEDLLIGLPKRERRDLVTRTALRFALYVVDLPASERDHDARPFGLLDHSLRVARAAAGELVRPGFRASEDPAENYREQPIWAYSGFVLGLLHDAGKMLDLEVVPTPGGPAWNPLGEPLAAFLGRSGNRQSGRESWHWKEGRGTSRHIENLDRLVPFLLPAPAKFRLGSRLGRLTQVFRESYVTGRETWARDPAGRVVSVVRHWDQELSKAEALESKAMKPETPSPAAPVSESGGPRPSELSQAREGALPCEPLGQPQSPPAVVHTLRVAEVPQAPPVPDSVPSPLAAGTPKRAGDAHGVQEAHNKELWDSKVEKELQPDQLMRSIRGAIKNAKVSRNGSRGPVFVCKDYIWLKYPEAFMRIMEHVGVRFSVPIGDRILGALLGRPETVPENPRSALVLGVIPPRGKDTEAFVRFRAQGFFPDEVLAQLGLWPHEIKVIPPVVSRTSENRQLPLWPERRP